MKPYIPANPFYVQFDENWYNKGDILLMGKKITCKVLETPYKKWYKQLLQFITFGLYKAPYQYKLKRIK